MVDIRNITYRCISKTWLHLNFSETIQIVKNFINFIKSFSSVQRCSDIRNLIPQSSHPLNLFSGVVFEHLKTAILSDNDIFHGMFRNKSGSVSITLQSVKDKGYIKKSKESYYYSN